ncbi:MAG: DUF885 domain-containing protein [Dokdonella sp.]|uniref:DUF885 domain-containing protein n=1 Tax=Dokdonella sp. TaxID=2291710 RepID=UPI0025C3117C|nr:DUF885 domain-containing protein [Dokdonella sp.]MBZ0222590.1 DUF885 domain-containing protein [Dokdonella sp.]MCC7254503.1 DUF885 domain-containing protein [Dokdonella sp.]
MSRLPLALAIALLLGACAQQPTPAPAPERTAQAAPVSADTRFTQLGKDWLDGILKASPVSATQFGDHHNDSELDDFGAAARARSLAFSQATLAALDHIDRSALSRENQVDYAILHNQLQSDIWSAQTLQEWTWNPLIYTGIAGNALFSLMARDFAPLPQRLRAATARMEKLPALYAQMRTNLDPARVPKIHAETASRQLKGVLAIADDQIIAHASELSGEERQRLDAAIAGLRKAIDENQKWIDSELVPKAKGDFRIGATLYDQKLAFSLNSPLSRQEIRQRAEQALSDTRAQMYEIARRVLKGKRKAPALPEHPNEKQQQAAIQAALDLAYADHPARDQVVATAQTELAKATDFVRNHDLVTMPDAPVEVITMPEFARGVALAYCDSPGPLDKGLATFYAVSPIPDDWTKAQVESFLREYNTRSIAELTVHEAMPGHFLQLWHSNRYPSVLRAVLGSGTFIEGWAVYAEQLMVDQGFLDHDPLFDLVHLKWNLRVIANALLDQGVQVDGMTREQAMQLMTIKTFQQEREAAAKWVRAQLTAAQLPTYFVGWQEHLDLRREAERRWGKDFTQRRYNDAVLSFGSPPVRYVRELMFDLPIQ